MINYLYQVEVIERSIFRVEGAAQSMFNLKEASILKK